MRLEEAPTQYDATTNILTIILTNTSPAANGGFLTADAFSLGVAGTDDIQVTAFTGDSVFTGFELFPSPLPSGGAVIPANPFTNREFLISATAGDFEGGGSPSGGIPVGASATFSLTLSEDLDAAGLASFFDSEAIRFRGFEDGGSDKSGVTSVTPIPEPGTLLLLGTGLAGAGALEPDALVRAEVRVDRHPLIGTWRAGCEGARPVAFLPLARHSTTELA